MAQSSLESDRLSSTGMSTLSSGTAGTVGGSVIGARIGESGHKMDDENEFALGPLPPLWEKAFTPSGEVYFIDHNLGTSHWLDPRLARVRKRSLGECGEDELPYGWERVTDERYGSYYVDHINRRTQYENPVLQARRLRVEKLASENSTANGQSNISPPTGELRGDHFTLTLIKGTQGLGFTLIGADVEGMPEIEGYLQIRSIVPHSPAWIDGALQPGDVLIGVGTQGVRGLTHAQVAQIFQSISPGTPVTLHLIRGYPLAFDSEDPNTRVLSTLAVDATTTPPDAVAMQQLTQALRTRFNLDDPNRIGSSPGREEPDRSPLTPQSPGQRRMLSRSFDLDAISTNNEPSPVTPRCPSADHLLSNNDSTNNNSENEIGREFVLTLRRGAAGFGFTIADSVHGQKVKKVLDRSRCAGLREGDLLLKIGETDVRHAPHQHVVQVLKECPAMHETTLRVWRKNNALMRTPRSRSATRVQPTSNITNGNQLGRSKTPTADQLRSQNPLTQDSHSRLNEMNSVEATYAVPEHKRESILDRRRRSSTPGGRLTVPIVTPWSETQTHDNDRPQSPLSPDRETWLDNSSNIRSWAENAQKWDESSRQWESNNINGNVLDGSRWNGNMGNERPWGMNGNWGEVPTPTVHVDTAGYWRGNASVADSSDNGGFPEDGMLHSPTTAAISGLSNHQSPSSSRIRPLSPSNSANRMRSHSPSNTSNDRLLTNSPGRFQSQSPSNNSLNGRIKGRLCENSPSRRIHSPVSSRNTIQSPSCFNCTEGTDSPMAQSLQMHPQINGYSGTYPQVEAGGATDPDADVLVRLARGTSGFGFRIVGGTEDGSRVAVGYVVPGGPADGLLRPGDLLTSVDGISLIGATHARAVAYVCQSATRGHVTLGVRHNRADIQQLGVPTTIAPHAHQTLLTADPSVHHMPQGAYNILHPAPLYPPSAQAPMYNIQYDPSVGNWPAVPYDVTVTRNDGEGFGFVVISSTNKATSTIGQLIPNSPAVRCGFLHVGDTILAINRVPIRNLPHPEVVALIKQSGRSVILTVQPPDRHSME